MAAARRQLLGKCDSADSKKVRTATVAGWERDWQGVERNPRSCQEIDSRCGRLRRSERSTPGRIRTCNLRFRRRDLASLIFGKNLYTSFRICCFAIIASTNNRWLYFTGICGNSARRAEIPRSVARRHPFFGCRFRRSRARIAKRKRIIATPPHSSYFRCTRGLDRGRAGQLCSGDPHSQLARQKLQ